MDENATSYPGPVVYTGQTYHEGSLFSGNNTTNGSVDFDVLTPATLTSVKVYTDTPGDREFQLLNSGGGVVQSLLVNVPMDSSRVTLNWPLTVGTGYSLTTNAAVNMSTLGTTTPRLQRSNAGVTYPYSINNIVSLTGSNQGANYYYYFYDWEVQEEPTVCVSDRVPVVADIATGINTINNNSGIQLFPNPATDKLTVKFLTAVNGGLKITLTDLAGRMIDRKLLTDFAGSEYVLNLKNFAHGTYLIKVSTGTNDVVQRIVVE